jgi:hypothetical protein
MTKVLTFLALLLVSLQLQAQTLNFSVSSVTTGGPTITPRLTWSTNPAATSCTASGATGWSGTKGPSGVLTLAPIAQSETYSISCSWPGTTGSAVLTWTPPTQNTDGSALTDLSGYIANYGTSATALSQSYLINQPSAVTATIANLTAGTYYFCVKATAASSRQSDCSNTVQKVVTVAAGQTISRTAGLVFVKPLPPTNLE